jgi:hypothetical protein
VKHGSLLALEASVAAAASARPRLALLPDRERVPWVTIDARGRHLSLPHRVRPRADHAGERRIIWGIVSVALLLVPVAVAVLAVRYLIQTRRAAESAALEAAALREEFRQRRS